MNFLKLANSLLPIESLLPQICLLFALMAVAAKTTAKLGPEHCSAAEVAYLKLRKPRLEMAVRSRQVRMTG